MTFVLNSIFIAYELRHIDEAQSQAEQGITIVCLDFLVERELKKRNIPFVSLRDFLDSETGVGEWWELTHKISREWHRLPVMKFFEYDGIPMAEALEPLMQAYLARLFYYIRVYEALKIKYPQAQFSIPIPSRLGDTIFSDCLSIFHPWAIVDAARIVGLDLKESVALTVPTTYIFPPTTWKTFLLSVYNAIVSLVPRRRLKIYASAYWTHLTPVIPYLDDTELIFFESKKFYEIPWRLIWKHRIRILRSHDVISFSEEQKARQESEKFAKEWPKAKSEVARYLTLLRRDLDWSPIMKVFDYLITYAPQMVADIRSLRQIMMEEKPGLVLQLASVGGPLHYFLLMARVAAQLKIPSIELQHAGATIDPRSIFSTIETDYLASYGDNVNAWHKRLGHASRRLISVGSPRFDHYINQYAQECDWGRQMLKELGLDLNRPVLLVTVPFADTFITALDSYQLAEFYETIRTIQKKVPNLQILFKHRPDKGVNIMNEYLQELFSDDCILTSADDIFPLLCASDAVICNNSTVIYQVLLAKKPLILYPWKRFDTYHAKVYESAAPINYSPIEVVESVSRLFLDASYRERLLVRQEHFLKNYAFDGKSSERMAKLIKKLTDKEL